MSTQITTAFIKQFHSNVEHLSQQMGSVLSSGCRAESQSAKVEFFDQIGATAAVEINSRHADTPQIDTPHSRRSVTLRFFVVADLIDKQDKIQTLIDPANPYAQSFGYALGRAKDDVVIANFFGTSYTGEEGSVPVTFPAGNIVAVNFVGGAADEGMLIGKLLEARRLFKAGQVDLKDPNNALSIAIRAKQSSDLLGTTQVTSSDYNVVKALVNGDINTFLGMRFVDCERIGVAGGHAQVPVWAKSGVLVTTGMHETRITQEMPNKNYATQVWSMLGVGATRMEEAKQLQILCQE